MKEKWEQNRLQLEDTLGLLAKMEQPFQEMARVQVILEETEQEVVVEEELHKREQLVLPSLVPHIWQYLFPQQELILVNVQNWVHSSLLLELTQQE